MKPASSDEIARHKYFLRLHYRAAVRALSAARRRAGARRAALRVSHLPEFGRAHRIGVFLSLPFEIDTAPLRRLARRHNKPLAVPVVFPRSGRMRFAALPEEKAGLRKNEYGILEPIRPEWVEVDLVIVPGAAFTSRGDRLGAGAGYYDRFLAGRRRPRTVGICFDEQLAARLPRAGHDRRVDAVVTPSRLY